MPFLIGVAVVLALGYFFPRATNVAAYFITFGFLVPLFVVGAGSLGWAFTGLFTDLHLSFLTCCGLFGAPMGLLVAHSVLS